MASYVVPMVLKPQLVEHVMTSASDNSLISLTGAFRNPCSRSVSESEITVFNPAIKPTFELHSSYQQYVSDDGFSQHRMENVSSDEQDGDDKHQFDKKPKILGSCKVCGDDANGMYFGALVCVPCKTFFLRYYGDNFSFTCASLKNCEINVKTRTKCKYCRMQKCLAVGMLRRVRPSSITASEGQQLCVVCSDVANGLHFGAVTCEGCKKFFRRGLKEHEHYSCKGNQNCDINPRTRNSCRFCRYQRCLLQGMCREAIQMGRPSKFRHVVNNPNLPQPPTKLPRIDNDSNAGMLHLEMPMGPVSLPAFESIQAGHYGPAVDMMGGVIVKTEPSTMDLYENYTADTYNNVSHYHNRGPAIKYEDEIQARQSPQQIRPPTEGLTMQEQINELLTSMITKDEAAAQQMLMQLANRVRSPLAAKYFSPTYASMTTSHNASSGESSSSSALAGDSGPPMSVAGTTAMHPNHNFPPMVMHGSSSSICSSVSDANADPYERLSKSSPETMALHELDSTHVALREGGLEKVLKIISQRIKYQQPIDKLLSDGSSVITAQFMESMELSKQQLDDWVAYLNEQHPGSSEMPPPDMVTFSLTPEEGGLRYWLSPNIPDTSVMFSTDHNNIIEKITSSYTDFVKDGSIINRQLTYEFKQWYNTLDNVENIIDVPDNFNRKIVELFTKCSTAYCNKLPGFTEFDINDKMTIVRLGQSQSRILAACCHWYNPHKKDFDYFLSWKVFVSQRKREYQFKELCLLLAQQIQGQGWDPIESAVMNALVIIATDFPGLTNSHKVEDARMKILQSFQAYITVKYGSANTRLADLCRNIPSLRQLGLLHYKWTLVHRLEQDQSSLSETQITKVAESLV